MNRAKLDVTPRSNKQSKRFERIAASPEFASSSKQYIPPNTEANTQWAVRTFDAWRTWRSTAKPEDPVPEDILSCADAGVPSKWLSLFVLEARKLDGSKYPSNTLSMLLSGLKHYMVRSNPDTPNFLDENDPKFSGLRETRDTVSRRLREEGVGTSVKHTAVISHDEESALWESGVIGVHNPKSLLNAVFFLNGKVLCLRGGREHKSLKVSQFAFRSDEGGEYVLYTENDSKNRSGTYKDNAGQNKVVKHYSNEALEETMLLFKEVPSQDCEDSSSTFYWKPKDVTV